mgnify:CR=1 FL=1
MMRTMTIGQYLEENGGQVRSIADIEGSFRGPWILIEGRERKLSAAVPQGEEIAIHSVSYPGAADGIETIISPDHEVFFPG